MHKKLEEELASLAQSILEMKDNGEVLALKEKARHIYERLVILAYLENKQIKKTDKEEPTIVPSKDTTNQLINEDKRNFSEESKSKEEDEEFFEPEFNSVRIDIESLRENQISSKEEFRGAISADKTASLFDNLDKASTERKTLNDRLVKDTIQIGLNDRFAFVKHLFNSDQSDFNRVLSQLNTFKTENDAKNFIYSKVKPEYNWTGKEEYEERLITIIERKFS